MRTVFLIGMMGCGKSTCARLLGERLGVPVLDTDEEIERRAGMAVSEIFKTRGEAAFRHMETELLRSLAEQDNLIVACGGGLPLREENRAMLRNGGTVVFLNRDPETIYETADMSGRPLGQEGREAFLERFCSREPLYRMAADVVVENFDTPEETVEEILQKI